MNIAVCDDDETFLDQVKNDLLSLTTYNNEFTFSEFRSGSELISDFSEGKYDMIILDIEMKGVNGLKTAEILRVIDDKVILVFISNYEKYACQGYEVRAFRYILKNQPRKLYMNQLEASVREYYRNTRYLIASDGEKEKKLPTDEILYMEVFSHKIMIHARSGDYVTKGTLSEFEAQLSDAFFSRLDKSSLVNIINIDYIRKNEITLINGSKLFASRNHIKNIKESFMDYSRNRWS